MAPFFRPVLTVLTVLSVAAAVQLNDRPVIGVYRHPSDSNHPQCGGRCEVLEASYVKWVESAGGRVVPIPAAADNQTVARLFASVNGLLLPGGGTDILPSFKRFYELAVAANRAGDYFPVWGTCLGFEWLLQAQSGNDGILDTGFDSENISLPLNLTDYAFTSRMFQNDQTMLQVFAGQPITMNNHNAGIETEHFGRTPALSGFFSIISVNNDRRAREFVSAIEGKDLPIYGVQFHPEKNNFEFGENPDGTAYEAINHSADAVLGSQFLSRFFVNEARRSAHRFATPEEEAKALIYNYLPAFTGPEFLQTYFFKNN